MERNEEKPLPCVKIVTRVSLNGPETNSLSLSFSPSLSLFRWRIYLARENESTYWCHVLRLGMFIPGRAKFRLAEINIIVRGRLNLNRDSVATRFVMQFASSRNVVNYYFARRRRIGFESDESNSTLGFPP